MPFSLRISWNIQKQKWVLFKTYQRRATTFKNRQKLNVHANKSIQSKKSWKYFYQTFVFCPPISKSKHSLVQFAPLISLTEASATCGAEQWCHSKNVHCLDIKNSYAKLRCPKNKLSRAQVTSQSNGEEFSKNVEPRPTLHQWMT